MIYSWRVDLTHMLDGHVSALIQFTSHSHILQHASDQWYNTTAGSGLFHLKIDFKQTRYEPLTIEVFDLLKVIGEGSFGKVMHAGRRTRSGYTHSRRSGRHIARRPGEITHILAERTVLVLVNNPFIVPLKFSFQNSDKLYLVIGMLFLLFS